MNVAPAALLDSRYRVGPLIARGGMSAVYRGTDTRLDRPVAIKIMDSRMASDPAVRTRFQREARSAARIDHPCVIDVHDQGDHQGPDGATSFLVMELVDGGTLRDVLRLRGQLGVPAAIAVLERVLAGLAEAHRLGLVHRDVKPENVLVSYTGEVKVADFGLVVAAAEAGASHAGMILGTVAYLSPEQVSTGSADARSDVYAAGVLLYELLTGEPPYRGETAISVAYRHVNSDLPAPSDIAGDVPPELDRLVQRAARRDPAGRPADAGALLTELRALAHQLQVPRVSIPVPPRPPAEDAPATAPFTAVGGSAGTAAAGAGAAPGSSTAPQPRPDPVDPDATRAVDGPTARPTPDAADATVVAGHDAAAAAGPRGTRALPRPAEPAGPPADPDPGTAPHVRSRRRSRRVFATWIAVVLVLALALAVSSWWLGSGRWTAMPPLVGRSESDAQQLLTDAGLVGVSERTFHQTVPDGVVAGADREPQTELLRGSTVTLTVSSGLPRVPDIAPGTSVDAAEDAIRDAGLEPGDGETDEFSAEAPAGTVLDTRPAAGKRLDVGERVDLVLSKGPLPDKIEVPLVITDSFADAEATLRELGLRAREEPALGSLLGRDGGRVAYQSPGAGEEVPPGTVVVLQTL